ncbi:unnamed protein product [Adineta ricciae]|uniref:Uncharacterized protein n=1 Tax=Adineta ricciae TaxID=249248 RepID=A0A815UNM4_ADIRI|nr:unnamed protein product [Adineta ricciae]CAF1521572.1 unnamed protein product [Adineta ricciae]
MFLCFRRYEPHNTNDTMIGTHNLTESERDLFKAFQSVIADQIRSHSSDLLPVDDSELEPISVYTEINDDSRFHFQKANQLYTSYFKV